MAIVPTAQANLLVNPSFETGDLTGWILNAGTTGGDSVVCTGTPFFGGASEGGCAIQLNGGETTPDAVLEQSFATTTGTTYVLSFDIGNYAQSGDPGDSEVLIEVLNNGTDILAGFPTTAQDLSGAGTPTGPMTISDFENFTAIFEATGSSTLLRITDQSNNGGSSFDTMLDNFSVTAIPVPAAFWLFGSGLLGLVGIARRKKAA
jgi:hypothetical protein